MHSRLKLDTFQPSRCSLTFQITVGLTIRAIQSRDGLETFQNTSRALPTGTSIVYGITDLTTFLLGTIFIVLLPGPNSVFVLSAASMGGVGAGYRAAAGIFVGDAILIVLAAMGAASVLYANPTLFMALKYAGAAYLAWIGLGLIRDAWRGWSSPIGADTKLESPIDRPRDTPGGPSTRSGSLNATRSMSLSAAHSPFTGALLVSLLNPKAIFFFISFFVQFVDPGYEYPALTFLILGIIVEVCSVTYMLGLIYGGVRLSNSMRHHPRLNALAAGAVGAVFIWFGVKLAQASIV